MTKSVRAIPGSPRGTYSEVVEASGLVFLAGQVADPPGGGDFAAEARQVYAKVGHLLRQVGLDLASVVRCTVYLRDFADFAVASEVFREHFPTDPPVRTTVGVAALARNCRIEVEVTAAR